MATRGHLSQAWWSDATCATSGHGSRVGELPRKVSCTFEAVKNKILLNMVCLCYGIEIMFYVFVHSYMACLSQQTHTYSDAG